MRAFVDSSSLLDDPAALRARFDRDGYVFLRQVVDRAMLTDLHEKITAIFDAHGWLKPGTDPRDALPCVEPCVEGEQRYFDVYDAIQCLQEFHTVPHHPSVRRCMTALLGDTAFPHPLSVGRVIFPAEPDWTTPPHQDFPNNQGTQDLYACWMPTTDCPVEMGSLSILAGSHKLGVAPLEFSLGSGYRQARLDERFQALDWVGGAFEQGDALVFHSLTVHQSVPNHSDRIRVSVDYRFQREGEPVSDICLQPHFRRLAWDRVYRGWDRDDLKYYWRDKDITVVPYEQVFHQLSEEEIREAEQIRETWLQRRHQRYAGANGGRRGRRWSSWFARRR